MAAAWTQRTPRAHSHQNAFLSNPRDERDKEDNAPNLTLGRESDPNKMKIWQIHLSQEMGIKYSSPAPFTLWAAEVFGRGNFSLPVIFYFPGFGHLSTIRSLWMRNQFRSIAPFSQLFSCRADKDREGWLKLLWVNNNIKREGKKELIWVLRDRSRFQATAAHN